jgi:hypothetical protein
MDAFFVVFEKVVIMVIMIAVGFVLTKIGTLSEKGAGEIKPVKWRSEKLRREIWIRLWNW